MAARYFIGTGGSTNWNNTASWSSTPDGLTTPASAPTSADDVYPSAICPASSTLALNVAASFKIMDWTGAANPPAIGGTSYTQMYGSLTFISGMTINNPNVWEWVGGGSHTLTMNGASFSAVSLGSASGATVLSLTLQDTLSIGSAAMTWRSQNGTFNTNGVAVTCGNFGHTTAVGGTLTLGSSVINCTSLTVASNVTLTANTSVIKVSGTGAFAGGNATYYEVQLNGTAHTITGNNTFTQLNFYPSGAQTLTFTGTTQTFASMSRTGV